MELYIRGDSKLPTYFQFPEFLLRLSVSQTAKLVYMLLFDRARLSQRNEWVGSGGRIYAIYPIEEIAKRMGKSSSRVKVALKELEQAGLLERESGGFSRPNRLYLKYIPDGRACTSVEKTDPKGTENSPCNGSFSSPMTARFQAPNKGNKKQVTKPNYTVTAGRYQNVFLTEGDYACGEEDSF